MHVMVLTSKSNNNTMTMKWIQFDKANGYRQKRPPIGKPVLVLLPEKRRGMPQGVAVGYRKDGAGRKDSPYFVVQGIGGEPIAWCDCLPDDFKLPTRYPSSRTWRGLMSER